MRGLTVADFAAAVAAGAIPLDFRHPSQFAKAHIAGAISVQFGEESFLPRHQSYMVTTDSPARMWLTEAGLTMRGFLKGGMPAWLAAGQAVTGIEDVLITELQACLAAGHALSLLDVRPADEFASGHIAGAVNLPLGVLWQQAESIDLTRPWLVIGQYEAPACAGASILRRLGCQQAALVRGGINEWTAAGFPLERVA